MRPELDEQLCTLYPGIFQLRHEDKSVSYMHWGFECNDGWYNIIDTLCLTLSTMYDTGYFDGEKFISVVAPTVVADQVKEKFGTLRFYYHLSFAPEFVEACQTNEAAQKIAADYANFVEGVVYFAEVFSSKICEVTGKPGKMHVAGGWRKTLNEELVKTDEKYNHYRPVTND